MSLRLCLRPKVTLYSSRDTLSQHDTQPYILKAGDMLKLADLWMKLTDEMRSVDKSWHLDMYAAIIAARRLGIKFKVERSMIGNADDDNEPWDAAKWGGSSDTGKLRPLEELAVQVTHYCQTYAVSSYSWSKHHYHELDMRNCDPNSMFELPQPEESRAMSEMHGKQLVNGSNARHVWLLENTMTQARDAIVSYYEEFCAVEEAFGPASLGLDCDRLGGPSEEEQMQYWQHNTRDLSYKSPYLGADHTKYLTFNPGHEGWNNARLYFGE